MNEIKISIVIPIYNGEQFLRRCLDSVVAQTYYNMEVILVDDGSLDKSGMIADEYAKGDKRIYVIHQENRGVSAARNAGILYATGNIITFVDSDDWISEYYLEELYNNMKKNDSDVSMCNIYNAQNDLLKESSWFLPDNLNSLTKDDVIELLLLDAFPNYVWGKLFKMELFDNVRFPEDGIWEDMAVLWKLLSKCKTIACVHKPLYYYFRNAGGLCSGADMNDYLKFFDRSFDRYEYFKDSARLKEVAQYSLTKGYRMEIAHFNQTNYAQRKIIKQHKKTMLREINRKDIYPLMTLKQIVMFELSVFCPYIASEIYRFTKT